MNPSREKPPPKVELSSYLEGGKINYGKLISDEVLAVDRLLVEAAKKNMDVAGKLSSIAKVPMLFSNYSHANPCVQVQQP